MDKCKELLAIAQKDRDAEYNKCQELIAVAKKVGGVNGVKSSTTPTTTTGAGSLSPPAQQASGKQPRGVREWLARHAGRVVVKPACVEEAFAGAPTPSRSAMPRATMRNGESHSF
jgi:hypothetical protein